MYELKYCSSMMKEEKETFIKFVSRVYDKKEQYLSLINALEEDEDYFYKGLELAFYELDSDEYDYPVHSWSVEFSPRKEKGDKFLFRGYGLEETHHLVNLKTSETEYSGNNEDYHEYINGRTDIDSMTVKEVNETYDVKTTFHDKIEEWLKDEFLEVEKKYDGAIH